MSLVSLTRGDVDLKWPLSDEANWSRPCRAGPIFAGNVCKAVVQTSEATALCLAEDSAGYPNAMKIAVIGATGPTFI